MSEEELKEQDIRLNRLCFDYQEKDKRIAELEKQNKELQKQISILLSCKNCPDNKGGYICEKEYNDKCLTQKIQYIKELQEEIAEAKHYLNEFMRISVASVEEFEPEFSELVGEFKLAVETFLEK